MSLSNHLITVCKVKQEAVTHLFLSASVFFSAVPSESVSVHLRKISDLFRKALVLSQSLLFIFIHVNCVNKSIFSVFMVMMEHVTQCKSFFVLDNKEK